MKVRMGVAIGGASNLTVERYGGVIDDLDRLGFDSVWLPETFLGATFDPLVGLAFAAARVPRLKLGTHLILPGRNAFRLARALAELDHLSGGRLLITAVVGLDDPLERAAQGLPKGDRGIELGAMVARLRDLWAGAPVDGATLSVRPLQDPLELWMGGRSPAALRRAGRLSDGWLSGGQLREVAIAGKALVEESAAEHGRTISPEHFGTNIAYARQPLPDGVRAAMDDRLPGSAALVPVGRAALRETIAAWVDAGFSKLVLRPAVPPEDWQDELEALAEDVLDLQT
jgi:probable F420-dependent oxidoreductase